MGEKTTQNLTGSNTLFGRVNVLSYVDHVGNMYSKDILDFDFDMFVSREGNGFRLNYNKDFLDANTYETVDEANEAMMDLVDNRNRLESIVLRNM